MHVSRSSSDPLPSPLALDIRQYLWCPRCISPSPDLFRSSLRHQGMFIPPAIIRTFTKYYQLLAETPEGIDALASFDIVGYAGAPLPDDLGDRLVSSGVNILSIYGTTETGSLMNSNRDFSADKFWNWVRPLPTSANYLVMEPQGGDTFEVVIKDGYPPKVRSCLLVFGCYDLQTTT